MRTTLIVLVALLVATPAMAVTDVTVSCEDEGDKVAKIDYSYSGDGRVRAFALKVSVDVGTIDAISDYKTGESSQYAPGLGYGIFPGSINLDDPENPQWNDPVAPEEDRGAEGTGIGTNTVILEMGSLYAGGEPNAPPATGTLCRLTVSDGCTMTIEEEYLVRGGVVLEDPPGAAPDTLILTGCPIEDIVNCWDNVGQCAGQGNGDGTCNGSINLGDLVALKAAWGQSGPPWVPPHCCSDYNHSGSVNLGDLVILKANWGTSGYVPSTGNQNCP